MAEGNTVYRSAGNCIIDAENQTLILGCKGSVIPADGSVTTIGENAFNGLTGLISITIPESITKIEDSAFENCTGLTEINWNAIAVEDFADLYYTISITEPFVRHTVFEQPAILSVQQNRFLDHR